MAWLSSSAPAGRSNQRKNDIFKQEFQYLPFVQRDENGSGDEIRTNPAVYSHITDGGDAE